MYQNFKSCVKLGNEYSDFFFISYAGVKQGEVLSHFLFSVFLNYFEAFFAENNVELLNDLSILCQEKVQLFVKLFNILYADDKLIQ